MEHQQESVRVGTARIGFGAFSLKHFLPEETIGRVRGTVIDDPQHESDYCMELDELRGLEPAAPFRYMNHSCQPNCHLVQCDVYDEHGSFVETELLVEVLEEIEPGQQLTIDYAWPAEVAIPCSCGSPNCRGWIVAEDEIDCLAV